MIEQLTQTAAFVCPTCGNFSFNKINVFDFSGKKSVVYQCVNDRCKRDVAEIFDEKDSYKIIYECPFCPELHKFVIKKSFFWKTDFSVYNCSETGSGLFIIGQEDLVKQEIKKQNDAAIDVAERIMGKRKDLWELLKVLTLVKDLAHRGRINCECGSNDVEIELCEHNVILTCKNCGSFTGFEASEETYKRLIVSRRIKINM